MLTRVLAALLTLSLLGLPALPAAAQPSLTWTAGAVGGGWYAISGGMAEIVGRKLRALSKRVEPAFGGALAALLRHQAGRVRFRLERNRHHLVGRRHFEIERPVDLGFQPRDVVVADMAAVFAQVRGDAVSARSDRELGRAHRIGMRPAARVADGGDVVDIDAEA